MNKSARRSKAAEYDLQELAYQIAVIDGRMMTAERLIDELIEQAGNLAKTSGVAEMGTAARNWRTSSVILSQAMGHRLSLRTSRR